MDQTQPKVKYKTFTYHTRTDWAGQLSGVLKGEGKPEIRVGSPPEFRGQPGVWSPEDLLVASVEICTMTTFLAYAPKAGIALVSYSSQAEGVLEFVDGNYRMTRVILRPSLVVEDPASVEKAEKLIHDAHKACFITNSLKTEVLMEPRVEAKA
jgi:organic hydroperoxide reductase OsmC/OhrA